MLWGPGLWAEAELLGPKSLLPVFPPFGKRNLLTEMLSSILVFCQRCEFDFDIEESL